MARHAWDGPRVPLPVTVRPHRHRRMSWLERVALVAVTWLALRSRS